MERTIKDRQLAYRQKLKIRSIKKALESEERAGEILALLAKAEILLDGYSEQVTHCDTQETLLY